MSPFPSISYPPEALRPKKVEELSQTFKLPHSLATYRNTPQNTSAASSCTSQATTAPRAAFRRAHKNNTEKDMGCSSSLPSEVIPDPGPTEQCTFTVKSAGMFKGDDCFAYRGDQCINQIVAARPNHGPPRHRRDASSMAWRCATPARWRGVVVYYFHPTSTRLTV